MKCKCVNIFLCNHRHLEFGRGFFYHGFSFFNRFKADKSIAIGLLQSANLDANKARSADEVLPHLEFLEFGRNAFHKHRGSKIKLELEFLLRHVSVFHQLEVLGELVDVNGRVHKTTSWRVLRISQFSKVAFVLGQNVKLLFIVLVLQVNFHNFKTRGNFVQSERGVGKHRLVFKDQPVLGWLDRGWMENLSVLDKVGRVYAVSHNGNALLVEVIIRVVVDKHRLEIRLVYVIYAINAINGSEHSLEYSGDGGNVVVAMDAGNVH